MNKIRREGSEIYQLYTRASPRGAWGQPPPPRDSKKFYQMPIHLLRDGNSATRKNSFQLHAAASKFRLFCAVRIVPNNQYL